MRRFFIYFQIIKKIIRDKKNKDAGSHIETVDTNDLPSGIYLIHLTTSDSHGVQKLIK